MRSNPGLLGAALLAIALPASPALSRPFYVINSAAGSVTLLDPTSVQTINGGPVRRAVIVTVQRSLTPDGPPQPGYVRTVVDHDCERQEARWVKLSVFSRQGVLILEEANPRSSWTTPAAATDMMGSLRQVCARGERGAVISAGSIGEAISALMGSWEPRLPPNARTPTPTPARPR